MNDDPKQADSDDPKLSRGDEHDAAILAADDTGMISGERLITEAEIEEAERGR